MSLSLRGRRASTAESTGVNYIGAHISKLGDPEHRPLAIAENKLSWTVSILYCSG